MQTSRPDQFRGPLDCLLKTLRHEGVRGIYKGATPPLVGWMFMDSLYPPPPSSILALACRWVLTDAEC